MYLSRCTRHARRMPIQNQNFEQCRAFPDLDTLERTLHAGVHGVDIHLSSPELVRSLAVVVMTLQRELGARDAVILERLQPLEDLMYEIERTMYLRMP